MPGTFQRRCSQSCLYSDETTRRQWWKIPLENLWKRHFRDSIFQSVPRCLSPKELVLWYESLKPPTIYYQPATLKRFDSPGQK